MPDFSRRSSACGHHECNDGLRSQFSHQSHGTSTLRQRGVQARFSFADPFGSGNLTLNSQTGWLSVTPNQTGIFVFAISVFEYRNGILLSENRRDFQIHVLNCLPQGNPPVISHDLTGLNYSNDTICVFADEPFCYDVTVTDINPNDTLVAYTVSAAFGNGTFTPPLATFAWTGINPIQGQVCWEPACSYDGQVIPLILGARDIGDCPNVADVFDTVWVKIIVPPNSPPAVVPDLTGLTTVMDTIFVAANDSFCFSFSVTDPDARDTLTAYPLSPIFNSADPPSFTFGGINPLQGQICWAPGCSREGLLIPLTFGARDKSICNRFKIDQTTVYVKITVPPNVPPVIQADLSALNPSNDTICVLADDPFCFPFTATDPDVKDSLVVMGVSPIFSSADPPVITYSGTNPVQGQICWTPGCQYDGQVIELIFGTQDQGKCSNTGNDFDTVYVKITVPPNAAPGIVSDIGGLNVNGDTIFVFANDMFCFPFTVDDPNLGDSLVAFTNSPIFNSADPPTFRWTGTNPLNGVICWTPGCQYVNQVIPLVFGGRDNARCNSWHQVLDTVYVVVEIPPNQAPTATHNFAGLQRTLGDTIFVDADEQFCYTVEFLDLDPQDSLFAYPISPVFTGTPPATFTWSGINPVIATICWEPSCAFEGMLIPFIVGVVDNGECNNTLSDIDTVWVKVSDPQTIPPLIITNLSQTRHRGDTIFVDVGDRVCYDFYVVDLTFDNGLQSSYQFQDLNGNNLGYGTLSTVYRNDTIFGHVCFDAECWNGGNLYRMEIVGIDKATCPPFDQTKKYVYLKVDTDFKSFTGPSVSFCEGTGGVQLNATQIGGVPPYTYNWGCTAAPFCGISHPHAPNPTVNPSQDAIYYVQVTDANGCTSEIDSILVRVLPKPIVDAGPDIFLCDEHAGAFLEGRVLNATEAPGPYTYKWTPPDGLNRDDIRKPYARPDSSTLYTLIVTSANGCSSFTTTVDSLSTVIVTVGERPTVDAGPDQDICLGDTARILAFASGASLPYRYEWTPSVGLSDSTAAAPRASPPHTFTYFFIAWSKGCPSIADSVTVHVHTLPTIVPGFEPEVCAGDTVMLDGLAGGDSTATYSYQWSPAYGLDNPKSAKPMAFPDSSTSYNLVVTSSHGCVGDPDEVLVEVLPTPMAEAGPGGYVCRGDSIQLQGSHSLQGSMPPGGVVFYEWASMPGIKDIYVSDPWVSPTQTTLYDLSVSLGSCTTHDQVQIDVFNAIDNSALSADTTTICSGDSVRLRAYGGAGSASYEWSPAAGLDDPNTQNPTARPDTTTTYTVRIEEFKCAVNDTIRIVVHPTPEADFLHTQENSCEDLEVSFRATSPDAISYIWDFGDGSPIVNEDNPTHVYDLPGTYHVRLEVTGAGGCNAIDSTLSLNVSAPILADFVASPGIHTPRPLPFAEFGFIDISSGAVSHLWDFGDGGSSIEPNPTHVYTEAGEYTVVLWVTDVHGCTYTIEKGPFVVYAPDLFIPNVFTPNGDAINDTWVVNYNGEEDFMYQIFDRWGVKLFESEDPSTGWPGSKPAGSQATEGVYFYVVKVGDKVYKGNLTLLR